MHALVGALGAGPVEIFASSGGAVTSLALVAAFPDDVTTLVAHEPPLIPVLPDAEAAERAQDALASEATRARSSRIRRRAQEGGVREVRGSRRRVDRSIRGTKSLLDYPVLPGSGYLGVPARVLASTPRRAGSKEVSCPTSERSLNRGCAGSGPDHVTRRPRSWPWRSEGATT